VNVVQVFSNLRFVHSTRTGWAPTVLVSLQPIKSWRWRAWPVNASFNWADLRQVSSVHALWTSLYALSTSLLMSLPACNNTVSGSFETARVVSANNGSTRRLDCSHELRLSAFIAKPGLYNGAPVLRFLWHMCFLTLKSRISISRH